MYRRWLQLHVNENLEQNANYTRKDNRPLAFRRWR